jgi:hypothetical protein
MVKWRGGQLPISRGADVVRWWLAEVVRWWGAETVRC